jgi:Glycosyl transferases group 1/Resolvase, N terminal domain
MHILGAIAEFERASIAERVKAGLQRARAQGKRLGRPRSTRRARGTSRSERLSWATRVPSLWCSDVRGAVVKCHDDSRGSSRTFSSLPSEFYFEPHVDEDARILLFSERNTSVHMWEVPQLEFEDVICEVDAVHMLAPPFNWRSQAHSIRSQGMNWLRKSAAIAKQWPIDDVPIDRDYEMFFAVFHFPANLAYLNKLKGWRQRCRTAACFLIEMWTPQIPSFRPYLRLLRDFDHVFLFNAASVPAVAGLVQRPCHFLATATDAIAFCPYPSSPERTIDCFSIGRGSPAVHRQLLDLAERDEIFYVHDRVNHLVPNYRAHRKLLSNFMKRSRYFSAYRINEDRARLTGGEEALATRYFEGAAGGAVIIGSHPECAEYHECFDWPDATIPVPWEPDDMGRILAELDAQLERIARARRNNVVNSLRRHDWVHRWAQVLNTVGLEPTSAVPARLSRLEGLAQMAEAGRLAYDLVADRDAVARLGHSKTAAQWGGGENDPA